MVLSFLLNSNINLCNKHFEKRFPIKKEMLSPENISFCYSLYIKWTVSYIKADTLFDPTGKFLISASHIMGSLYQLVGSGTVVDS